MIFSQQLVLVRGIILAVVVLLNCLILSVSYINNRDLLWLLLITMPLLLLAFYLLRSKKRLDLKKYFIEQQINAIRFNSKLSSHSDACIRISENDLSTIIGNDNCTEPYSASIYNIRVRDNFNKRGIQKIIKELPEKDDQGAFTEDALTYHLVGGEKILEIGPEYAGCRSEKGGFDERKFKQNASKDSVKLVELNLSPANKQIPTVLSTFALSPDTIDDISNLSTLGFTVFFDAEGMAHFIDTLRQLSNKPVGIRICVTNKKEFYQICHAFVKTKVIPDFIVLEGAAKSSDFAKRHSGMSLYEALLFVPKTLQVYGLDKNIKIIASTDIVSGFDMLKILALGADAVHSDMPGYKIAKYYGNESKEIFLYKSRDIAAFHEAIINATIRIMQSNRFQSVSDITLERLFQRLDLFFAKSQLEKYSSNKNSTSATEIHEAKMKGRGMVIVEPKKNLKTVGPD